jgi:hypothetical protein
MKIPSELFIRAIQERKVYYFTSEKISSEEPHHFICLKKTDEDILIMSCCTSQYPTMIRLLEKNNLPNETIVWVSPADEENPFTKNTYVNCNEYFTYTIDEFKNLYESDKVKFTGEISEIHYEQILIGIQMSPLIDDETKELLPKPY